MAEEQSKTEETTAAAEPAGVETTDGADEAAAAGEPEAAAAEAPAAEAPEAEVAASEEPAAAPAAAEESAAPAAPEPESEPEAEAAAEEPTAAEEPSAEEPAAEAAAEDAGPAAPTAPAAPTHTYDELKGMTVAQMREIAEGMGDIEVLHGYTTMHKEELLVALCKAQGIEAHEHHEVVGIDKSAVKAKIRELKQQRDALIEAKDSKQLKIVRRRIRSLKRKIHKATV